MAEFISVAALRQQMAGETPPLVIDVRSDDEYAAGHIPGARHLPADDVAAALADIPRDRLIVPY